MENHHENKQKLFYEISGPEVLKDRIPLYEAIGGVREYMNIIDRTYLTLTDRNRLTKKHREKYKIIAYRFNPGSLTIDLVIELLEVTQYVFPFLLPSGALGLWNLTKSSYNFAKLVTEMRFVGKEPEVIEDRSTQYYVIGDKNKIMVNPVLAYNADRIEDSAAAIGNYISPGSVDKISLEDEKKEGIVITEEERMLFNPETVINDTSEIITAKIYRLDTESKKGKLHIIEGMEPRDIPFQIVGDQGLGPYIDALKLDRVKVKILTELAKNISGKPYIKRLQLLSLPDANSNQKKLF